MNRILIIAIVLLSGIGLRAQQDVLFSSYHTNDLTINPAAAGANDVNEFRSFFRREWVAFPGGAGTQNISYNSVLGSKKNHGLGVILFNDRIGPEQKIGVAGSYALKLLRRENSNLSLGVGLRYNKYRLNQDDANPLDPNDPNVLAADNINQLTVGFGLKYTSDKIYAGVSLPTITQLLDSDDLYGTASSIYVNVGGYLGRDKEVMVEPAILARMSSGQSQLDFGVRAHTVEKQLILGVFYRAIAGGFLSTSIGVKLKDKLYFGYMYDYSFEGDFQKHSHGSHEIYFGLDIDWSGKGWND